MELQTVEYVGGYREKKIEIINGEPQLLDQYIPDNREVLINGVPVEIRTQEFDLLLTLARHPGIVLSRNQLLDLAWGYDYYGNTRTVDVHIGHLRKKIQDSGVKIETFTGVGYKLVTK